MIAAFSSDMRIGVSRSPLARISSAAKAERRSAIAAGQFGGAERDRVFGAGEIAQAAGDLRQPVGIGDDVVEKLAPVVVVHVGRVDIVAQQFGRALDRRQRRFQLVRDMGGEGRDEVGARVQPPRHVEKALRQPGEFAGAVMPERAQRVAVALADQVGALDQFAHRPVMVR